MVGLSWRALAGWLAGGEAPIHGWFARDRSSTGRITFHNIWERFDRIELICASSALLFAMKNDVKSRLRMTPGSWMRIAVHGAFVVLTFIRNPSGWERWKTVIRWVPIDARRVTQRTIATTSDNSRIRNFQKPWGGNTQTICGIPAMVGGPATQHGTHTDDCSKGFWLWFQAPFRLI